MANYKVVEMFDSINRGEAKEPVSWRCLYGCRFSNLNCRYCDTAWANEEEYRYHWTSIEEILEPDSQYGNKNVTITGGEPLQYKD